MTNASAGQSVPRQTAAQPIKLWAAVGLTAQVVFTLGWVLADRWQGAGQPFGVKIAARPPNGLVCRAFVDDVEVAVSRSACVRSATAMRSAPDGAGVDVLVEALAALGPDDCEDEGPMPSCASTLARSPRS